jgi:serine/threonine protein kinase
MIGRTLDRYRVESKIREGGMGVVYKARGTHLGRTVAIKVLPPASISDPARKQRFAHEAKAASALNHPNMDAGSLTRKGVRRGGGDHRSTPRIHLCALALTTVDDAQNSP